MKNYNEILQAINNLPHVVQPTKRTYHNLMHGDGLIQAHPEDHFEQEEMKEIKFSIWKNDSLSLKQKLTLNAQFAEHLPK